MSKRITLTLAVLILFVVSALPVLSMLLKSLLVDGHFSLDAWRGLLASAHQWLLMRNSFVLASLVTLFTFVLGVPLGILLGKSDLPLRRFLTLLFTVPLLIPPYIVAVSWFDLLGRGGLLARGFGVSTAGIDDLLFGLPGCVFVLVSIYLPIPMLLTMIFTHAIDPRLEEAGRLFSGWRGVLRGITLPLILPGLLLSALLVFLLAFGEFSVPTFLRYAVFPVESFTQFSAFYDFDAATVTVLPMAGVALFLLVAESVFLRDRAWRALFAPASARILVIPLGAWRRGWLILVALMGFFLVIVPLAVLPVQATGAYGEAFGRAAASLWRSLAYAAGGATLLVVLGFLVGYLIHTKALRCWRSVDTLTLFLFALPGTVIGIGLIGLWNRPATNWIYATPLIILFGYLAKYTALTSRITVSQLARIPSSMEEAARIAGAGWYRRLLLIVVPLARRGLLAGWLVAYLFSLRDTSITMLVYPPGHETLPVRIFTLMANGSPSLIAALCVIMVGAALLPAGVLWAMLAWRRPDYDEAGFSG